MSHIVVLFDSLSIIWTWLSLPKVIFYHPLIFVLFLRLNTKSPFQMNGIIFNNFVTTQGILKIASLYFWSIFILSYLRRWIRLKISIVKLSHLAKTWRLVTLLAEILGIHILHKFHTQSIKKLIIWILLRLIIVSLLCKYGLMNWVFFLIRWTTYTPKYNCPPGWGPSYPRFLINLAVVKGRLGLYMRWYMNWEHSRTIF